MESKYIVSFIVPSYNEESNISLLYKRIKEVYKSISFEVIYIDDGSKDSTFSEIKKLAEINKNIKGVSFARNFGKEAAIYVGLERAEGEYICLIDADLQQDPEVSLKMIDILNKNKDVDCVSAIPNQRKENVFINFIKSSFYWIINMLSEVQFQKNASDYRMFRINVKDALLSLKEKNRFSKGMFSWIGYNTDYIYYDIKKRASGKSKWSLNRLFKYSLTGISSFSSIPLSFSLYFGIVLLLICICLLIAGNYVSISNELLFFVYLLIVICLFISIGIIGFYLSKIYSETRNRPIYIIKDEI